MRDGDAPGALSCSCQRPEGRHEGAWDEGVLLRTPTFPGHRPLCSLDEEGTHGPGFLLLPRPTLHRQLVTGSQPGPAPRSIREQGADCLSPRGSWLTAGSLYPEEIPFKGDISYFSIEGPP